MGPTDEDAYVGRELAANFDSDPEIEIMNLGADLSPRAPGLRILELVEGSDGLTLAETGYDPKVDGGLLFHDDFDGDGNIDLLLSQEDAADEFVNFANDGEVAFTTSAAGFDGGVPEGFEGFTAMGYFDEPMAVVL
ncbi:hypothetical protein [Alloyangia pacifica]|uniref:hypothetical protein n=1 Tax=Alloyangia pacifica TaxID=311180 RepID=UPI001CD5E247|nr:hypothetical protein [Alloyangia pacifica]MCA0996073.1 hypothetical protein [Alloyangia pacifica]